MRAMRYADDSLASLVAATAPLLAACLFITRQFAAGLTAGAVRG